MSWFGRSESMPPSRFPSRTARGLNLLATAASLAMLAFASPPIAAANLAAEHPDSSRSNSTSPLSRSARIALRNAQAAWDRGDYAVADSCFRQAWLSPDARAEAARALHELHTSPEFRLKVDEVQITRTMGQLGSGFDRYETEHFVIFSDCDPEWTRARGELLEQARDQFFRVAYRMGIPAVPHEYKLLCILFNDQDRYAAFAAAHDGLHSAWVAGYYATGSNRIVFYNDSSSRMLADALNRLKSIEQEAQEDLQRAVHAEDDDLASRLHASGEDRTRQVERERTRLREKAAAFSTAKTIHEAVHLLAFNTGVQRQDRDYPFWLSEGLATSFETEDPGAAFGPEYGSTRRDSRFRQMKRLGRLMPLREFLTMTDVPGSNADTAAIMYTQGHALFEHLYRNHREALGRYVLAFGNERSGRISGERHVELFTAHFGDPETIERAMLAGTR